MGKTCLSHSDTPMSTTVGEVSNSVPEFEWSIADIFSLPVEKGEYYRSPISSHFWGASWYLQVQPIDSRDYNSEGWIGVYLLRGDSGPPVRLTFTLALKTVDGKKEKEQNRKYVFDKRDYGWGCPRFLKRSELVERKSELAPSDVLTITCSLRQHCPKDLKSEKESRVEASTQTDAELGLETLSHNFKNLLLNGQDHDLTLQVKDKEFRAHQCVLRARSQVFESMLSHDMVEKNSGVINVPDCDTRAFEQFLFYLYTGKVETLDENNMLGLYYVADKYNMADLREECSEFVKKSLSSRVVCDVIQLALNHSDSGLLGCATDYFVQNADEILPTVGWQSFIKANPTQATELFIKTVKKLNEKKT